MKSPNADPRLVTVPVRVFFWYEENGGTITSPMSGDLIKIKETWPKVVVPLLTSALTLSRTLLDPERRDVAEPADLFPAAGAALDPAACGTRAMFGGVK